MASLVVPLAPVAQQPLPPPPKKAQEKPPPFLPLPPAAASANQVNQQQKKWEGWESILYGWNSMGSSAILAAYVASIPEDDAGGRSFVVFIVLGALLCIFTNSVWWLAANHIPTQLSAIISIWQSATNLSMEIALLLILSQPISEARNSVMHVPIEYGMIPLILSACIVTPSALAAIPDMNIAKVTTPPVPDPAKNAVINPRDVNGTTARWIISILNMIGIVCAILINSVKCAFPVGDFTKPLPLAWKIVIFIIMVFAHSRPVSLSPSISSKHGGLSQIPSRPYWVILIKLTGLALAFLFAYNAFGGAACDPVIFEGDVPIDLRENFYMLRVLSNTDKRRGEQGEANWGGIIVSVVMRISCILSACLWSAQAYSWGLELMPLDDDEHSTTTATSQEDKQHQPCSKTRDSHDAKWAFLLACVTSSVVSVSYNGPIFPGQGSSHSLGLFTGQMCLIILTFAYGTLTILSSVGI